VDLNVVNGSEGFLRAIDLHELDSGSTFVNVAIVEFPSCHDSIQLDGLPPGYYPIYPDSCTLKVDVFISGKPHTISVQRHQVPLQLAFSRTAHGAQGKTMSAIGSDLNFGGAKAYVIASRARDRGGLALVQPVTLEMLNSAPPRDLRVEHGRQKALEHNTLVRLGYSDEDYIRVPDPEAGLNLTGCAGHVKLTWNIEGKSTEAGQSTGDLKRGAKGSLTDEDTAASESRVWDSLQLTYTNMIFVEISSKATKNHKKQTARRESSSNRSRFTPHRHIVGRQKLVLCL
jgi:hypothetical protein